MERVKLRLGHRIAFICFLVLRKGAQAVEGRPARECPKIPHASKTFSGRNSQIKQAIQGKIRTVLDSLRRESNSAALVDIRNADCLNAALLRIYEVPTLEKQCQIHQGDHYRNFNQRPDDGGKRRARVDAEY